MKRTGLIGLGTITKRYIQGLKHTQFLSLCAVSDINPGAVSREAYSDYPFYDDYRCMIQQEKPELVIISSPPAGHFDIALYCLEHNVGVIIEKPVVLQLEQFDRLCKIAQEKGLLFRTLFHWLGGIELRRFMQEYNVGQIKRIDIQVMDPYSQDEQTILEGRRPLMGAWIDSGVNALSMIKLWLPFANVELMKCQSRKCKQTGLPLFVDVSLNIDGVDVHIQIDWTKHQDLKQTTVTLENRTVQIQHSAQSILDGENLISCGRMERMDEHYYSLFGDLEDVSNHVFSRAVHEILLEVEQSL